MENVCKKVFVIVKFKEEYFFKEEKPFSLNDDKKKFCSHNVQKYETLDMKLDKKPELFELSNNVNEINKRVAANNEIFFRL